MVSWARTRRASLLAAYSILLIVSLAVVIVASLLILSSKGMLSDKLAEVADVIAGGTSVLAVLAGLVAIQAYAAATGLPKLDFQIWFNASEKNVPVFRTMKAQGGMLEVLPSPPQATAAISLHNHSHYSARSVTVVLNFLSIRSMDDKPDVGEGWECFEFPDARFGQTSLTVQWSAGLEGIVHGGTSRRLPDLQLGVLACHPSWAAPKLSCELIADGGYRRRVEVPIYFVDQDNVEVSHRKILKANDWL